MRRDTVNMELVALIPPTSGRGTDSIHAAYDTFKFCPLAKLQQLTLVRHQSAVFPLIQLVFLQS